jgi:hypothetical protein
MPAVFTGSMASNPPAHVALRRTRARIQVPGDNSALCLFWDTRRPRRSNARYASKNIDPEFREHERVLHFC